MHLAPGLGGSELAARQRGRQAGLAVPSPEVCRSGLQCIAGMMSLYKYCSCSTRVWGKFCMTMKSIQPYCSTIIDYF